MIAFQVADFKQAGQQKIKLSGFAMHSALGVKDISTVTDHDNIAVYVHLVLVRAGASGNFSYLLTIPPAINTVSFGQAKVLVWQRNKFPN